MPYVGPAVGAYTDWTPLEGRNKLLVEDLDKSDPWQVKKYSGSVTFSTQLSAAMDLCRCRGKYFEIFV